MATSKTAVRTALLLAALLGGGTLCAGDEPAKPTLNVGDPAPTLYGLMADLDTAAMTRPHPFRGRYTLIAFWWPEDAAGVKPLEELHRLRRQYAAVRDFGVLPVAAVLDLDGPRWLDGQDDPVTVWTEFSGRKRRFPGEAEAVSLHRRFPGHVVEGEAYPGVLERDVRGLTSSGRYGVTKLPAYFLVGPEGTLLAVRIPPDQLDETLKKHLPAPPVK